MHDGDNSGVALVRVPKDLACDPVVFQDKGHEYRVPGSALASFGWEQGVAEAIDLVRSLHRKSSLAPDVEFNKTVDLVVDELDRLRAIGR